MSILLMKPLKTYRLLYTKYVYVLYHEDRTLIILEGIMELLYLRGLIVIMKGEII